jgi:hypothetical protein
MIDFSKLTCQVASGAAVGIGVDENNKSTFYLPIGYTALTTADEKKQAFFELYRLFKAYVAKNNLDTVKDTRSSQNGTVAKNDGYKLAVKDDDSETMLHTKVNFLDTIIDAFDPYAIQNIANRKLYSEEFELEDALNHLDDAVFMPNHAFMVDQAIVDQKQVLKQQNWRRCFALFIAMLRRNCKKSIRWIRNIVFLLTSSKSCTYFRRLRCLSRTALSKLKPS